MGYWKTRIYFQTIYIAILYTYRTLLFDIVSTIVEVLVVAGHQVLYICIVEWCRLRRKPHVNRFFDLVVVMEPPATKEIFSDVGTHENYLELSLDRRGGMIE
jgi:hypothetical protein